MPAALPTISSPRRRGFTLLELLIVLVVLGLLASLVAPKYFKQLERSEARTAQAQIEALAKALDLFRLDTGHYPSSEPGLAALVARPSDEPKWNGPYLAKDVPPDPWGRPYRYRAPGEHGDYDLASLGKDGVAGGEGENADVASWPTR
jgi:general secretion pathway protein G